MDKSDVASGYVVIADEQTKGRGQRGRMFVSPKRAGVYLSILLKLDLKRQDIRFITICAAAAVCRAIEKTCGVPAQIKWVNDVYCNGKKMCGILTEATLSGELQELNDIIVGIGINTGAVPAEIASFATSVQEITGMRGIRNKLIAEVLNQFETVYLDYIEKGKKEAIIAYYQSKLFITGQKVLVTDTDHNYAATVCGIDETGALIVKNDSGEIIKITTGEIKLNWGKTN